MYWVHGEVLFEVGSWTSLSSLDHVMTYLRERCESFTSRREPESLSTGSREKCSSLYQALHGQYIEKLVRAIKGPVKSTT